LDAVGLSQNGRQLCRAVQDDGMGRVVRGDARRVVQQRAHVGRSRLEAGRAGFHALEVEQVVEKAVDAHGLVTHDQQVLLLLVAWPVVAQ
jgi:hypothetical protein